MVKKLDINLQFFADEEKTEKATPKKRKDSREKGQVTQSKEVNSALVLLAAFITLKFSGKYMYDNLVLFTNNMFVNYIDVNKIYNIENVQKMMFETIIILIKIIGPIMMITLLTGVLASYIQIGFLFTTKTLKPKLNRINPIEGFKKLFSKKSLVELLKSLMKIVIVSYMAYKYISVEIDAIMNFLDMNLESIVAHIARITYKVGLRIGLVLLVLSLLDYGYQRWDSEKNLKMSKKEIKEEYKQAEGDPQIKSKIKEKQRQMAMNRMMNEVPKADVIITNPTHYAIAIRYDASLYDAPYVIAKGKDLIAQNIKKVAKESEVTMVENRPLAQALYKTADIGDLIPEDLYQTVAEILAYVYSLKE